MRCHDEFATPACLANCHVGEPGTASAGHLAPIGDSEKYAAEVTELLDELASYERYWLFPGTATLAKMRAYLAGDDVGWLSHMATRAVHRLSEYGDAASLFDIDVPLAEQEAATTPGRRQFATVLLADDTPEDVPRALAGALGRLEVGTEDFVPGLLVVGSVEDALAAVALNDEIQACIIRRDLPLHAPTRLPLLDKLIDVGAETPAGDRTEHGIECGQLISELRPHLDLYLLTDESVATRDPRKHDVFTRTFYRLNEAAELHNTVLAGVRRRYETPFFDALRSYAAAPIGQFHALPVARGASIFNSRWL